MNTSTEINLISDEALDGVVGGSLSGWLNLFAHPAVQVAAYVTPWGQVSNAASSAVHAAASVVKHFKFW